MKAIYNRLMAVWAVMCLIAVPLMAQSEDNTFTVMSLNVDGLPGKLMFFTVNEDGPKSEGSERISEYIAAKDCDIVAMQEDFNYRWEIWSRLFAGYEHDEWSGGILTEDQPAVDYAHLHNYRFTCDGLNMVWKKQCQSTAYERVAWQKSFGKFSHDFDDIITKGFRRHEVTLPCGTQIVVYNMHMDASSERDESLGNDSLDRAARQSQWVQLREHILANLDQRPVIVMGDMNSLYHRDPVQQIFVEAIQQTGCAMVGDAWVQVMREGVYPLYGGQPAEGETLDKVLYINPSDSPLTIEPRRVTLDTAGYLNAEGQPLGDHYPLIVTFALSNRKQTGIDSPTQHPSASVGAAYTLQGTRANQHSRGVVIHDGHKVIRNK